MYEEPKMELIELEILDMIRTSPGGESEGDEGGSNDGPWVS